MGPDHGSTAGRGDGRHRRAPDPPGRGPDHDPALLRVRVPLPLVRTDAGPLDLGATLEGARPLAAAGVTDVTVRLTSLTADAAEARLGSAALAAHWQAMWA